MVFQNGLDVEDLCPVKPVLVLYLSGRFVYGTSPRAMSAYRPFLFKNHTKLALARPWQMVISRPGVPSQWIFSLRIEVEISERDYFTFISNSEGSSSTCASSSGVFMNTSGNGRFKSFAAS